MAAEDDKPAACPQRVAVVRRNPWVMGLAALPFAICLGAIAGAIAGVPKLLVLMPHGLGLGAVATWYAWGRNPWPRLLPADLQIDEQWLVIGERRHARADLQAGFLVPGDGHVTVQLKRRGLGPALELRVADEAEGRALLQALGLAATQTVATFRTMSRMYARLWRLVATVFGGLVGGAVMMSLIGPTLGSAAGTVAFLFMVATIAVLALAPTRVEVGADGVLVRWLGRQRFFGHDDIRGLRTVERGWGNNRRKIVELDLRSGETFVIPTGKASFDFGRARSLEARIRAAQQAWAGGESVHAEALLRRGNRTHQQWIDALRRPDALVTHRSAPVAPKRLWRIVEDPQSQALDRAAAAVALTGELDSAGRDRLARSAAGTAAPSLRIALDAVAQDQDEDALAEALAEIEADEAKRQTKP
ncbi:MAG: PH domain-containing protein [Deltaproteobacteria bacterium]|nr:PH domain-containing protein [Deltaproteobacteria bacterium]